MKYIVVSGGVVSGLGKGITISSIGRILKSSGLRVTSIKIDPYLNVDAGTMSPFEHGEAFVLDDGGETDLDLGNYERFLDITLTAKHNITSGKIYKEVISQERRGDYLGKTVQMVPHATDMVQKWIEDVASIPVDGTGTVPDVCLVEVGGTVGDIESMVFLEALRQFQFRVGRENILFVHVSLVPVLGSVGEQKTKPTQHTVKELMSLGLTADIIVCRSSCLLEQSTKNKISSFCHVPPTHIISVHDVSNIYHVPLILVEQNIHTLIKSKLQLTQMKDRPDMESWSTLARTVDSYTHKVTIALVGKYVGLEDAYLSVTKALSHAAMHLNVDIKIKWIEAAHLDAGTLETDSTSYHAAWSNLKDPSIKGILVPGGFGVRGIKGMIAATQYAREQKVPFLGLCLGMQVMVIEHAQNVLNIKDANSEEFEPTTKNPFVVFMPEISTTHMGGTMRLGARQTLISTRLDRALVTPVVRNNVATTSAASAAEAANKDVFDTKSLPAEPSSPIPTASNTTFTTTATAPATTTSTSNGSKAYQVDHNRSLASEVYGYGDSDQETVSIMERHRHRYEVNPLRVHELEVAGLRFTGRDEHGERMEIAELSRDVHPHFLGVQYHPELKSRPDRPSPPVYSFACVVCAHILHPDVDSSAVDVSKAGAMWRDYEQDKRKEIDWIYSPKSGLKKRPVPTLSDEKNDVSPFKISKVVV